MAFKNEYIQEADYEKYDLRRFVGEQNPFERGYLFARQWTIDREKEVFLAKIWTHREAEFDGWSYYWKGEWMFFEMRLNGVDENRPDGSCWVGYLIRSFSLPSRLEPKRSEIMADLDQALSVYCGVGVFSTCTSCTAIVEIIGGNLYKSLVRP